MEQKESHKLFAPWYEWPCEEELPPVSGSTHVPGMVLVAVDSKQFRRAVSRFRVILSHALAQRRQEGWKARRQQPWLRRPNVQKDYRPSLCACQDNANVVAEAIRPDRQERRVELSPINFFQVRLQIIPRAV